MKTTYYKASLKGLRETNEDAEVIIDNYKGQKKNIKDVTYMAVFDGHGGSQISSFLGENLQKYFIHKDLKYPLSKKYIKNVFDNMQNKLINKKGDIAKRVGSTALIVLLYKHNDTEYINIMNLGDCRAVICRNNIAVQLTKDHKPNWPEEKHRVEKLGGQIYFDGNDWRVGYLSVSRSFGDLDATPYVSHIPDTFKYRKDNNDMFIIIACDGLWDVLTNNDAVNFVLSKCYDLDKNKRINKNINIAEELASYAINQKGSTDNVSVIVYFFD